MRLLQLNPDGEFSLTKDLADEIPPYAILSHTWGDDDQEVTWRDVADGSGNAKAGYQKLQFCAKQAAGDNLQHVWIDTCCIDKSNNTELSEAINSMFRWYREAVKCYVYLADVRTNDHAPVNHSTPGWEPAFRKSRWFTRGWTLQELLAPRSVEFFSADGQKLGDKKSLEPQVHNVTGIAAQALQGTALGEFSINERMSWAENRTTKREEDRAYSLLGIFDIHMPLIYGEGANSAFRRLREEIDQRLRSTQQVNSLNHLPYAVDASFNSYSRQHEPTCLANTRMDILHAIHTWADGQDTRCIYWLSGLAGAGKSTIARTIARRCFENKTLGASFFFTKGGGDVGNASKFVTSVAVQLANSIPLLHWHICAAVTEYGDIANQSLRDQWHKIVLGPLSKLGDRGCQSSYVLVIDALDECDDDNNIRTILQLLSEARSLKKARLRVFLTSRPEIPIRHGFHRIPDAERQDFVLQSIPQAIVDHDISLFLEHKLMLIGQEWSLDAGWPGEDIIKRMVEYASGLFIWAATACRFVQKGNRFAAKRLNTILESDSSSLTAPEKHLDEIYITVLEHSISSEYTDEEKEYLCHMLREVVGSLTVLFSPLSIDSLGKILKISREDIDQTLEDLHAILDIPKDQTHPLRLHHPSFRNFLLDSNRCGDLKFQVDERQAHQRLAIGCIQLMSKSLKQDVCEFDAPGTLAADVDGSRVERSLPSDLQYACLYWIQHLQKSGARPHDHDEVHQFLHEHLLHWLEALGWIGKVPEGIRAITSLGLIIDASECSKLSEFIYDTKRFVLYNRAAIEQAPLQTYCSALIFAPASSVIRKQFQSCVPRWMRRVPEVEHNWNALLQTLECCPSGVIAVAFSPDGKQLASACQDHMVKLWDAGSGAALQTLEGHSDGVTAITFSPDGNLLASASWDGTMKLWDAGSGAARHTIKGHSSGFKGVAFSPDSKLLASASRIGTLMLWDPSTGAAQQTLEGHSEGIEAVIFSPDGTLLASASGDETAKLWDASSGVVLQTLKGHSGWVNSVAFSPDGKLLASASGDDTVKLWDTNSGAALHTLNGHDRRVNDVAFSPHSNLLASASRDRTVRLWDSESGAALQTLKGHSGWVSSVAFSPDGKLLASASQDGTVKLWDAGLGAALQTLEGHSDWITAMVLSPNGRLLAWASEDEGVKLWDISVGAALRTIEDHSDKINAVAFSPDSKLLASASQNMTVKLWDASSGAALQTWGRYSGNSDDSEGWDGVEAVTFSPNGKLLAAALDKGIIKLWDISSGAVLQTLDGNGSPEEERSIVVFSSDSKLLASVSWDKSIRLWDVGSGAALQTLNCHSEGHPLGIEAVAISPDGKLLASASYSRITLWDLSSGAAQQTLEGHSGMVNALAFSPDGKLLASASEDETVKLWDTDSGATLHTLEADSTIHALSFSDDGTFFQTNRGSLHTTFLSDKAAVSRLSHVRSVFVKEQWVSFDNDNLLWLPPDYRPDLVTVHEGIVVFGYKSGRVLVMEFAL